MHKEIIPAVLLGILVSCLIWLTPNFFEADTYFNPGDAVFPFNPEAGLLDRFLAWNISKNSGLGGLENYKAPGSVLFVGLVYVSDLIGIPSWFANRLYFLFPTLLEVFGIVILLRVLEVGKSWVWHLVGGLFFVSSLPLMFLDPLLHFSIAGLILACAGTINSVDGLKYRNVASVFFGFLLLSPMIRYVALYFVFVTLFLGMMFVVRANLRLQAISIVKTNFIATLFFLPLFVYAFFPYLVTVFSANELASNAGVVSDQMKSSRLSVINFFERSTTPDTTIRLHYNLQYSMYFNFFKHPIAILSSMVSLYVFLVGVRSTMAGGARATNEDNLKIRLCCLTLISLLLLTYFFGTDLHHYMVQHLPLIWILNNPQYGLVLAAIFYCVFIVLGLQFLASRCHERYKDETLMPRLVLIVALCGVIGANSMTIFDYRLEPTEEGSHSLTIARGLGNHDAQFLLPKDYFSVAADESDICQMQNALIVPMTRMGYYRYSFEEQNMRPLLDQFYCFNFVDVNRLDRNLYKKYVEAAEQQNSQGFSNLLAEMNVSYVIVSNDVIVEPHHLQTFLNVKSLIETNENVELIFRGDSLSIYRNKQPKPVKFVALASSDISIENQIQNIDSRCFLGERSVQECDEVISYSYKNALNQIEEFTIKKLEAGDDLLIYFASGSHPTWILRERHKKSSLFSDFAAELSLLFGADKPTISKTAVGNGAVWSVNNAGPGIVRFEIINKANIWHYRYLATGTLVVYLGLLLFAIGLLTSRRPTGRY